MNYTGVIIAVTKCNNNNLSLMELKTITENDLISNGINILSSDIYSTNSRQVLKLSYIFNHEGIDIIRESINFIEGHEVFIIEFSNVKDDNHGNPADFNLVINSFEIESFSGNRTISYNMMNEKYIDGTYKVGIDLPVGEYKFTQNNDNFGSIERARDSSMEISSVIAMDMTHNNGETRYVTVKEGEYIKIIGGELIKI
ncbi:hypothetical protein MBCUT_13470 [Methanobrevibacter cuticularis]|uniref:Uncharacterized protein n=1 Tax=Methanobrevibacter cuticularis TaxID=47311 RepID=A0A166CNV4_9EURY|nr:hypothetical protein [Methanobrevibacter cuticularis]KZX15697.1 hypothetical protein MBCUT_13470 [Methanobrevibacter cuticularis]